MSDEGVPSACDKRGSIKPRLTFAIQGLDATGPMREPYQVCKGFVEAGWDVDILTVATPANTGLDVAWGSVPVRKVRSSSKFICLAKLAWRLIRRHRGHIVMTSVWDWHCFSLMVSRLLFGNPYAVVMDTYTHRHPFNGTNLTSILWHELRYGLSLRTADILLAEAPLVQQYAQQYAPGPDVLLIPHCLWLKEIQAIERQWATQGLPLQRETTILFTGRIIERKKIHDLIEAFSRLTPRFSEWRIEIRGPVASIGYERSLRAQINAKDLGDRVSFAPSLTGEALYRRYRETSIYALPSTGEGFPGTILEAMYFGGAIVAASSGYVSYQLDSGRCGLIHKPGDVDTLTRHLESLMTSAEMRMRYMNAARDRVETVFAWERYFDLLERKMRDLTAQ